MIDERRYRAWYKDWFDREEYEVVYGHRDDDEAAKLINLIVAFTRLAPASRVLDIGCGRGRHAIRLASQGYRVTGVDLSRSSIDAARVRASSMGLSIDFEVGDMRELVCDGCFSMVVNMFTAFGFFEEDDEHERAIASMSKALYTDGWLVQDFLNAENVRRNLVPESSAVKSGMEVTQKRWIEDGRINKSIELRGPAGVQKFSESVRLLTLEDFDRMYRQAGLVLHGVFGDYDGGPFGPDSPRLIMFARKHER